MRNVRRLRPSPALVISTIALFVAIGGISWAAATIGTNDIKNNAVTAKKLHKKAVTTKKIKNNAVNGSKVRPNAIGSSEIATGAVGADVVGTIVERSAESAEITPDDDGAVEVQCHAGEQVLAGGNDLQGFSDVAVTASRFEPPNGWEVFMHNADASGNLTITVHAYCLQP